ncbi:O-antigen ligase family protein [Paraburkholderia sp. JPY432]|uniref:O-antigen ligase family protein n=1 Tax=Paraburkholderia youngii TaxID=2782701 RepID=UPI00159634C1|nr:O-antigen ligase family protein [Paraburkholderia youngii]NVH73379.1 O-antigen ligase family protein [Paraburkholderia youngii]
MAYLSLLALFMTVTNFVPLSAIGFVPLLLLAWRFYGRTYPAFITPLTAFTVLAIISTLLYDPQSFLEFEFYRRDGNFFISYLPIFAGCVYAHRWDMNKVLRSLFIFAVVINLPMYAYYIATNGLFSIFIHPNDTFGSYFIARNAAGGFLAMLFCLGVACYLQKRSKLIIALLFCTTLMLFSTYSRGSLLGAVAVLPYLYFGRKRWILGTLIAVLLIASAAIAIYHTQPNVDYMGYTFAIHANDAKVNNLNIRYEWLWPRALAYFVQSPLVGLGFGSFDDHIGSLTSYFHLFAVPSDIVIEHSDSHAHNSYLNILAELGVVGLTLILAFFWKLVEWSKQGAAYAALVEGGRHFAAFRFVEISSVCLLVMSATEHRLVTPSNVLILSLVISLLLAARPLAATAFRPGPRGARKAGVVGARATQPVPRRPTHGATSAR